MRKAKVLRTTPQRRTRAIRLSGRRRLRDGFIAQRRRTHQTTAAADPFAKRLVTAIFVSWSTSSTRTAGSNTVMLVMLSSLLRAPFGRGPAPRSARARSATVPSRGAAVDRPSAAPRGGAGPGRPDTRREAEALAAGSTLRSACGGLPPADG